MPRLVALADSFAFHGPRGPLMVDDPRVYPNVLCTLLGEHDASPWEVATVARSGWSVRDVRYALYKDVHLVQRVLAGADAIVFGIGSIDTLSVGVPRSLIALLPYVRPPAVRRHLRATINRNHAALVRASRGRLRFTPRSAYRESWQACIDALRWVAPSAALCAVLPAIHDAPHYAHLHPFHAQGVADTAALARAANVPTVDLPALLAPHRHALNPDGVHWPFAAHRDVAAAMAAALLPQLDQARAAGPDRAGAGPDRAVTPRRRRRART